MPDNAATGHQIVFPTGYSPPPDDDLDPLTDSGTANVAESSCADQEFTYEDPEGMYNAERQETLFA